ncbi:MAG: NUDIX domain-containing protein [Firmicutes bacterium]|nr:NUDIX domain-containing protein [Bacillota bacterium]
METKSKKIGVGVGVMILNKQGQVLLGLRNPDKVKAPGELRGEGTWTMPGGKVDFHETLGDAARRETHEETNLSVKTLTLISLCDDFSETAHYVTAGFLATDITGELKTMEPETILEWRWFDLDNLPKNIYEPSKKLLENYHAKKIY